MKIPLRKVSLTDWMLNFTSRRDDILLIRHDLTYRKLLRDRTKFRFIRVKFTF